MKFINGHEVMRVDVFAQCPFATAPFRDQRFQHCANHVQLGQKPKSFLQPQALPALTTCFCSQSALNITISHCQTSLATTWRTTRSVLVYMEKKKKILRKTSGKINLKQGTVTIKGT